MPIDTKTGNRLIPTRSDLEIPSGGTTTKLFRVVSMAEYEDLQEFRHFRPGPNSFEGKWFADSFESVSLHAKAHYPNGYCQIVTIEIGAELWQRAFRLENLDGYGPATYLDLVDLEGVGPIFEEPHG